MDSFDIMHNTRASYSTCVAYCFVTDDIGIRIERRMK